MGSLEWINGYRKKRCKSIFWRMKAAFKNGFKNGAAKQQFKFQYDPCSYALNFDDGFSKFREGQEDESKHAKLHDSTTNVNNSATWVYVLWLKSE